MPKPWAGTACRKQYRQEIIRQTDVYAAWIAEKEQKDISGKQVTGGPLITVVPFFCYREWKQSYTNIQYIGKDTDILDFASMDGEYVAFVNGEGNLEEDALTIVSDYLNHDLIYSDEDGLRMTDGARTAPFFKPDLSPDTLSSFFYFENFFVVKRSAVLQMAIQENGNDIDRLYDFVKKYVANKPDTIHIARILYHKKLKDGEDKITYAINEKPSFAPIMEELVSVIILSKDHPEILKQCTESIKIKSQYNKIEVIIVDNGSQDENRKEIADYARINGFHYVYEQMEFNYSIMCQMGVQRATGEYLLFLNDDIEVGDASFLEKMLRYARMPHVGAVGAKLLYPASDLIQHVGITDLVCGPSHKLAGFSDSQIQEYGRNRFNYDVLAVTGACLLVSRQKYFQVNGFSDKMGVSYNDVDLCVSLYEKGYYNVICNDTFLYHHESLSRGMDTISREKNERLIMERQIFYDRHKWLREGDPFYNVNLSRDTLAYEPDVFYEAKAFGYYNLCHTVHLGDLPHKICQDMQLTIEKTEWVRGFHGAEDDYYRIEGWSLHMKRDNACLSRKLYLIPDEGEALEIEVSRVIREDVYKVFPKARNSLLAGFVCRIRADHLLPGRTYQTMMIARSQTTGIEYKCMGEPYEPTGK